MTEGHDIRFRFGPFTLDPVRRVIEKEGTRVRIRPKGFDILLVLVEARGRLVAKDDLMKAVWPDSFVEESNLTLQISLLRKALQDEGQENRYICTLPGRGYQFVAPVSVVSAPPEARQPLPAAAAGTSPLDTARGGYSPDGRAIGRNNLPLQPTRLIGRNEEVKRIGALLSEGRLITLTGAPGVGKTRLALQIASDVINQFPDGVFFVELASIRDPELAGSAIFNALGLQVTGPEPLIDILRSYLEGKRTLLVLDNFEHVLPSALLVAEILSSASEFKVLATSRAALDVTWEQQYTVEPLPVPEEERVAGLMHCPSVALFVERACAVEAGFELDTGNSQAIAEICRRLDGLPLAIELVARQAAVLSPAGILQRLERDAGLLGGAPCDAPSRHETMQKCIQWSYDLLREEEKVLFSRLSVFVGGFTLDAAEAVCLDPAWSPSGILRTLKSLARNGIIQRRNHGTRPRFVMLEVIREYGLGRLTERSEADLFQRTHAAFFCQLAERNERPTKNGETLNSGLSVLGAEIGNLRAALGWCRAHGQIELQMRIAAALRRLWIYRASHQEGTMWLESTLMEAASVPLAIRAKALSVAGILARIRGDYAYATSRAEGALTVSRELGDDDVIAESLMCLGEAWVSTGSPSSGLALFEESLAIKRRLGDTWRVACLLLNMAVAIDLLGNSEGSLAFLEESLSTFRSLGDSWGVAKCLNNLGWLSTKHGNHPKALMYLHESLALANDAGNHHITYGCLETWAALAGAAGDHERALRLLAAVDKWRSEAGTNVPLTVQEHPDETLTAARNALPEPRFSAIWKAGRSMTTDEAVRYALNSPESIHGHDNQS